MPYAETANSRLFYAARGTQGPAVVYLHGAGDTHLVWNGQLAALAGIARGFSLDLPGHGRSDGTPCRSIAGYAAAVLAFLDAHRLAQAVLVGSSMGGAIALTFALEFPTRTCALGLVGTGARLRVASSFLDGIPADLPATARLLASNYYAPDASPYLLERSARQLLTSGPDIVLNDYLACDAFDVRDRLHEIHAPALVICGRMDRMTPPKYSEYVAANLPAAELVLVESAGHMVMLEQPQAVNAALLKFLTNLV